MKKHNYARIWMHYVWTTHNRENIMNQDLIKALIEHFKAKYPTGEDVYVDTVNGVSNHVHLLVGQQPVMSCSKVANQLKGESSHWINAGGFLSTKFAWQTGFGVFSVSHSQVQNIRNYIYDQQEHHRKITYEEEVERFLKHYGLEPDDELLNE